MQQQSQPGATRQRAEGAPPPYPGAPRWVKVLALIVGTLIVLAIVAGLTGIGGPHRPGRHLP
jgi:hypothetical protein